jgi:phosphate starvation-inducible membrane PsiE
MNKTLKAILFHEVLMLLMGICLTAIIVVIYREYDQASRIFLFWFAVLQVVVVLRVVQAQKR